MLQQIEYRTQSQKNVIVRLDIMTRVLKSAKNAHMRALNVPLMRIIAHLAIQFREYSIITGVIVR